MWAWYETLMPPEMNIRIDLLLIIGEIGLIFMVYAVRLVLFWVILRGKRSNQSSVNSHT